MTISSETRKAGPFTGNGITATFPFTFKVFQASDVKVVRANTAAVETILVMGTDYTISLNANQDSSPGGSITLTAPLTLNYLLSATSKVPNTQTMDLTNQGGFYPKVISAAMDRLTVQVQQVALDAANAVKVPLTSTQTGDQLRDSLIAAQANSAVSAASAAVSASSAAATLVTFNDQYLGAKTSNPTLNNSGGALVAGNLYFNSIASAMRTYTGTVWADVAQGVSTPYQVFNGTGAQTAFTLSSIPGSLGSLEVFVAGSRKTPTTDYSISGTTLTFVTAPTAGTANIFVRWITTQAINVPADASVSTSKLVDGSVTAVKMAAGAATGAALGSDVVQTSGAQTIAGVKTFSSQPVLSAGAQFSDATQQNTAFVGSANAQVFTGTGTFTVPAGITKVRVTLFGGGGGGGNSYGRSGGNGGCGTAVISGLTPGGTITVSVGTGGAGVSGAAAQATLGGSGGTTSFGVFASATGGGGSSATVTGSHGTFSTTGTAIRKNPAGLLASLAPAIGGGGQGGYGTAVSCNYAAGGGGAGMSGGGGGGGSSTGGVRGYAYGPGGDGADGVGNPVAAAGGAGGGTFPGSGGASGSLMGGGGGGTGGVIVEW